jgi:hypothetical protein
MTDTDKLAALLREALDILHVFGGGPDPMHCEHEFCVRVRALLDEAIPIEPSEAAIEYCARRAFGRAGETTASWERQSEVVKEVWRGYVREVLDDIAAYRAQFTQETDHE